MLVPPAQTSRTVVPGTPCSNGIARALWIGGAGTIVVKHTADDAGVTFDVGVHTLLPVACHTVVSAGTTATLIVALY